MATSKEDTAVLITGGATGVGLACARRLRQEGAGVAIMARSAERVHEVAASLDAVPIVADVTQRADVERALAEAADGLGRRVNAVVASAGGARGGERVTDVTDEQWADAMAVNLTGSFMLARAALASMVAENRGSLVFISSVSGLLAGDQPAYSAAKAGLNSLARSIAVHYGRHNIQANALCCGTMYEHPQDEHVKEDLPFIPAGRFGRKSEIAALTALLCSNECVFLNGASIAIDGGASAVDADLVGHALLESRQKTSGAVTSDT